MFCDVMGDFMEISELKIGTLLEIYIRRDGYNYKVISKVEYVDDQRVGVTPIASRTKLFRFKNSDIVDIVYRLEDKSWKWSKVRAGIATLKDGSKLHVFVPDGKAESYNRRVSYRLPMSKDIMITYEVIQFNSLYDEDKKKGDKTPELTLDKTLSEISESYKEMTCRAYLRDLSEGGAAIYANVELKKGDVVSFEVPFGEETVRCRSIVIRKMSGDERGLYAYGYGLSYIETSSNYITYFFSEQRKMLSESKFD